MPTLHPLMPSADDLMHYLRIDAHERAAESVDVSLLIIESWAAIQRRIGRRIVAAEVTERIAQSGRCSLSLKHWPVASVESIVDPHGNERALSEFTAKLSLGSLSSDRELTSGEWTVTYTGGMSVDSDFESFTLPVIHRAVRFDVADKWTNRNPRATSEKDGDVAVSLAPGGLCADAEQLIAPLVGVIVS